MRRGLDGAVLEHEPHLLAGSSLGRGSGRDLHADGAVLVGRRDGEGREQRSALGHAVLAAMEAENSSAPQVRNEPALSSSAPTSPFMMPTSITMVGVPLVSRSSHTRMASHGALLAGSTPSSMMSPTPSAVAVRVYSNSCASSSAPQPLVGVVRWLLAQADWYRFGMMVLYR